MDTQGDGPVAADRRTKEQFEALEVLRAAAWRNFEARREYEWKFSFGLWTALALAAGALITRDPARALGLRGNYAALWVTVGVAAIVVVVHVWWSHNCKLRNDRDRRLSYVFERQMCRLADVDYEEEVLSLFPVALARRNTEGNLWDTLSNYWHFSHVAITFVLAAATVLAMWTCIIAPAS